MSEQPLTAEEDALRAWAEMLDKGVKPSVVAALLRRAATLDAARAGVPGDEGLRAAVDDYRADHPQWLDPEDDGCDTSTALRAALAAFPAPAGLDAREIANEHDRGGSGHTLGRKGCPRCAALASPDSERPGQAPEEEYVCGECGHDQMEHVHYCSHEEETGSCDCNAEYARVAPAG